VDDPSFPKPADTSWSLIERAAGHESPEGGVGDTVASIGAHRRGLRSRVALLRQRPVLRSNTWLVPFWPPPTVRVIHCETGRVNHSL
jgi:hypothetical protein